MESHYYGIARLIVPVAALLWMCDMATAQAPFPMQPPMAPVEPGYSPRPAPQRQVPRQPQQPPQQTPAQPEGESLEYAFRPDLTNPEFGTCLKLEKNWKGLWERYYQLYEQARMMNQRDPQFAQFTYYMHSLKSQLDAAWNDFSSRCVYFPRR